jgi:putative ATP-binding cassette transporter
LMAAPRFFSKQMDLGGLMQTVSAFHSAHEALSYLINSYTTIANWTAVLNRLTGFNSAIERVETIREKEECTRFQSADDSLSVRSLSIFLPDGKALIKDLNFNLEPGGSLLIMGPSGSGKSTLLRALEGIWPFVKGFILLPDNGKVLFLPQKPYLPLGTLRQALYYPHDTEVTETRLVDILDQCHLTHLSKVLDVSDNWGQSLSLGEQQRVAFARILLQHPDYVFLDEATASLDEETEATLYRLVRSPEPCLRDQRRPRGTLRAWHDSRLKIAGDGKWLETYGRMEMASSLTM